MLPGAHGASVWSQLGRLLPMSCTGNIQSQMQGFASQRFHLSSENCIQLCESDAITKIQQYDLFQPLVAQALDKGDAPDKLPAEFLANDCKSAADRMFIKSRIV